MTEVGCDACGLRTTIPGDTRTWFNAHRANDCPRLDFTAYLVIYPERIAG